MDGSTERIARLDRHLTDLIGRRMIERAARLVTSGRVFRRVVNADLLMASVMMEDAIYRPEVDVSQYGFTTRCDCDSPRQFCEHAVATALAYLEDDESFFDIVAFLSDLANYRKPDLLRMMRAIIGRDPESLNALGMPGFEEPYVQEDIDAALEEADAELDEPGGISEEELLMRLGQLHLGGDDDIDDTTLN